MKTEIENKIHEFAEQMYMEGYNVGYNEGMDYDKRYESGLNDAWAFAKELSYPRSDDEWKDFYSYFGVEKYQPWSIFEKYSAAEALAKFKEYGKDTSKLSEIHLVCAENVSGTLKFTFSNGIVKAIRIEDLLNQNYPHCEVIARGVPITHAVYSSCEKEGENNDNN